MDNQPMMWEDFHEYYCDRGSTEPEWYHVIIIGVSMYLEERVTEVPTPKFHPFPDPGAREVREPSGGWWTYHPLDGRVRFMTWHGEEPTRQ